MTETRPDVKINGEGVGFLLHMLSLSLSPLLALLSLIVCFYIEEFEVIRLVLFRFIHSSLRMTKWMKAKKKLLWCTCKRKLTIDWRSVASIPSGIQCNTHDIQPAGKWNLCKNHSTHESLLLQKHIFLQNVMFLACNYFKCSVFASTRGADTTLHLADERPDTWTCRENQQTECLVDREKEMGRKVQRKGDRGGRVSFLTLFSSYQAFP